MHPVQPPTPPPGRLAEEAILLDEVSGGRVDLGVDRGGPWIDLDVFGTGLSRYTHGFAERRATPVGDWLDLMAEREIDQHFDSTATQPPPTLVVLSEPEFADAVRHALRHFGDEHALAANPLLGARVIADAGPPTPATLRAVITDAVSRLGARPARALDRTYLRPAGTQEKAAEVLDLPFSTYRRHLANGIAKLIADIWHRELYPTLDQTGYRSASV